MFYGLVTAAGAHIVAVVGLAKNAGKTVALATLVAQAAEVGETLGLTSLGYDGERVDRLTRQAKPPIFAPAGTVIASAEGALERATASLELLRITNHSTALGNIVLARVREPGKVELAGPAALSELQLVTQSMLDYGASRVLIDGALNRVGSAAPRISQAVIVATGSSAAARPEQVIARTLHAIGLLTASPPPPAVAQAAQASFAAGRIGYWDPEHGARLSEAPTALGRPAQIIAELAQASYLCVPGAVTTGLIQALLQTVPPQSPPPVIVVPTGTNVFAPVNVWQRYLHRGGSLAALQSIPVLAVTANPGSAHDLGQKLANVLHPLPVYDLFLDNINPIKRTKGAERHAR